MNGIRALIFDDNATGLENTRRRFDTHFLKRNCPIEWVETGDPDMAQRIIATDSGSFDLFVIDLLFERSDVGGGQHEVRGFDLIAEAAERFPDAYILAISVGDQSGSRPDLFEDARRRGAHRAVRRVEFSTDSRDNSPAALTAEIQAHLLDTGTGAPLEATADDHDPEIQSVLFSVGGMKVLTRLYSKILSTMGHTARSLALSYLTPGVSGAYVCAVDAYLDDLKAPVHHVLKLSPDLDAMKREAEHCAAAAAMLPNWLLVRQQPDQPVGPVKGWYGLVSQLQNRAMTLREWLRKGPPAHTVTDVFETLLADGLGAMYQETCEQAGSPAQLLQVPPHRQRKALHAIAELGPALVHPDGCALDDISTLTSELTAFITEGRVGGATRRRLAQSTYTSYAHGDLNVGNVLVSLSKRPAPVLIDTNRFDREHWATDPAHFAVDLLMHNVDGGVHSMFFTGFATWREQAAALGRLEPVQTSVTGDGATRAALAGLDWLTGNLRAFCPAVRSDADFERHRWEWHAALAAHLLRTTYHHEIPGPKRAMAIVAAHDQLVSAAEALKG
jgi:hypothetical protein